MTDIALLRKANASRWSAARPTRDFSSVARHLVAPDAKRQYLALQARTGVPWAVIAVIHEREASQSWLGSLAQGDRFDRVSTHVPAGRGPFSSWQDAGVDALVNCEPFAARNKDWTIGGALTVLEEYNGLGYAMRGLPSPYVWAGTDRYVKGKFTSDGHFDPETVDKQLGCAGMLMSMMVLDPTITFTGVVITPPPPDKPTLPPPPPSITNPAKGSIGAFIAGLFARLFGRRS